MTISYRNDWMAQALSIVAEHGIDGMEYNGLLERWGNQPYARQSKRMRVSLRSGHWFSGKEFEDYMILAWRWGLVFRSRYKELEWKHGLNKASYQTEDEIIRLTKEGWEFLDQYDRPLLHRWGTNIGENIPTVFISLVTAVLVSWAVYQWGPPKLNSALSEPDPHIYTTPANALDHPQ